MQSFYLFFVFDSFDKTVEDAILDNFKQLIAFVFKIVLQFIFYKLSKIEVSSFF
jgi:hypothetical protein